MAVETGSALGLYISVPFCRSKCTYCNFASGVYPASEHARYVERLIEEMRAAGSWTQRTGVELPRRVDTIYLGGGTPSLLEAKLIKKLFNAIHAEFEVERNAEITVECAPAQIGDDSLEAMAAAGVTRASLGVQSFVDREAKSSGRLHTADDVRKDLVRLRAAGIANINLDLIAGLSGQTQSSWDASLDALVEADVPHASVYMLEVDEESRLGREILAGGARYGAELVPTDEAIAQMYERGLERLTEAGYTQYEISNMSRHGYYSRHNLRYWERRPYLGLGVDASSMLLTEGEDRYALRATTTDELKLFLEGTGGIVNAETAWLNADRQHEEAWFLGLRLNEGVDAAVLRTEFGEERVGQALNAARHLEEDGLVEIDGERVRLTVRGRLLSNEVFQEFLVTV
ncbi:MAG: radical SAM family heme chaperone HemW [Acidobacteriota bacterium]|nr:radical SAM family heme chaperone HemW [Acidobacteriota bacterium]